MSRNRSWTPARLVLALALAATAGACGGDESEVAEEGPVVEEQRVEVTGITLGPAVGADRRVTGSTDTFGPTDTIYVSVETQGVAPAAELTARWTYQDGQVVDESSRSIAPNGPEVTEFHISKPDGWPAGDYEVAILLDGVEAQRASFTVEAGG
ncbi:MAG TPA: hypothetical protein VM778_06865 [Gemmatimonadota bacterium]|nr:hypothetical protein [Gemmatimonadota bacterium]